MSEGSVSERIVIVGYVVRQRDQRPTGLRVWSDGVVEHCAASNGLPTPTERLDRWGEFDWSAVMQITAAQVEAVYAAVRTSGLLDLPPTLLINYCKDDPGAAIWQVSLDGQTKQVIVYDPKPRRSPELDKLTTTLDAIFVASA